MARRRGLRCSTRCWAGVVKRTNRVGGVASPFAVSSCTPPRSFSISSDRSIQLLRLPGRASMVLSSGTASCIERRVPPPPARPAWSRSSLGRGGSAVVPRASRHSTHPASRRAGSSVGGEVIQPGRGSERNAPWCHLPRGNKEPPNEALHLTSAPWHHGRALAGERQCWAGNGSANESRGWHRESPGREQSRTASRRQHFQRLRHSASTGS